MKKIQPGSTIGVMGSGQLGRMFAETAIRQGYRVVCYSPDKNSPAAGFGATDFSGNYDNTAKLSSFLQSIDALTFEFENIPEKALSFIENFSKKHKLPVSPSPQSIRISQKRNIEKQFFRNNGLKTANFVWFPNLQNLKEQYASLAYPLILKTNSLGYDGKGQYRCKTAKDLQKILPGLPEVEYIAEEIISFDMEISVIAAGFADGKRVIFPPSQNIHKNGILDFSIHPAEIPSGTRKKAEAAAKRVLQGLHYQGVLGLEMFVRGNDILMNEFAPRPHNSGHYTQNAANISQFDLQLKAVCNQSINKNPQTTPCIMKNILGEDLKKQMKISKELLNNPDFHLHLYGKDEAKKGRKMGHWNYTGNVKSLQKLFG